MTQTYYPFDAGAGNAVSEQQWTRMARHWLKSGVVYGELNALATTGDSTGLHVKVATGSAFTRGHFFDSDAVVTLPLLVAPNATFTRYDVACVRLDPTLNTVALAIVTGTASASPVVPSMTRTDTGIFEVPLAVITVPALAASITAGNVADAREYATSTLAPFAASRRVVVNPGGNAEVTSGGTYVTQTSMSGTIVTTGGSDIYVEFDEAVQHSALGLTSLYQFLLDGATAVEKMAMYNSPVGLIPVHAHHLFENVAAGSHTVALQWKVNGSANTATAALRDMMIEERRR